MEHTNAINSTENAVPCRLLTMEELEKISAAYCERTSGATKEYFRRRFEQQQAQKKVMEPLNEARLSPEITSKK